MGRRSFSRTTNKPTPIRKTPPPAPVTSQPSALGAIGQGMSLGAGAAIGSTMVHGAMDAMSSKPEQKPNPCADAMKQFLDCTNMATDLNACKPFLDHYSNCIAYQK